MNRIYFIGRLTKDPVLEISSGGSKYCNFTIAVDRAKAANGDRETDFPNLTAFGKNAENMAKFTEKGNLIAVEGAFRTSRYEKNGKLNYRDNLIVNRIEFLQWKKSTREEPPAPEESSSEIPREFIKIENSETEKNGEQGTEDDLPF